MVVYSENDALGKKMRCFDNMSKMFEGTSFAIFHGCSTIEVATTTVDEMSLVGIGSRLLRNTSSTCLLDLYDTFKSQRDHRSTQPIQNKSNIGQFSLNMN